MAIDIEKLIDQIQDSQHYVVIAKNCHQEYVDNFIEAIRCLENVLAEKRLSKLINEKLQFLEPHFKEKAFIQMACETSVNACFAKMFPESFLYEEKVNPDNE